MRKPGMSPSKTEKGLIENRDFIVAVPVGVVRHSYCQLYHGRNLRYIREREREREWSLRYWPTGNGVGGVGGGGDSGCTKRQKGGSLRSSASPPKPSHSSTFHFHHYNFSPVYSPLRLLSSYAQLYLDRLVCFLILSTIVVKQFLNFHFS